MKYFKCIRKDIPVLPFLTEIAGVKGAWDASTGRQEKIAVQREAHSIPLRGLRKSAIAGRLRRDVHESRWTTTSISFPHARRFLEETAVFRTGLLSRAKLVRLVAGRRVYPHIDRGEYYHVRDRFHLVLKSAQGSWLRSGDEEVRMQEGELWWFDNNQVHEAFNDGTEDRIHLIFDLLPASRASEIFGPSEKVA